jgi:hypothetical protein
MFEDLVNQFQTMSLGQGLYTICFTAFMLGGAVCCFLRSDQPSERQQAPRQQAFEPKPRAKPRSKRSARRKPIRLAEATPAVRRTVTPRLRAMPPPQRDHRAFA